MLEKGVHRNLAPILTYVQCWERSRRAASPCLSRRPELAGPATSLVAVKESPARCHLRTAADIPRQERKATTSQRRRLAATTLRPSSLTRARDTPKSLPRSQQRRLPVRPSVRQCLFPGTGARKVGGCLCEPRGLCRGGRLYLARRHVSAGLHKDKRLSLPWASHP